MLMPKLMSLNCVNFDFNECNFNDADNNKKDLKGESRAPQYAGLQELHDRHEDLTVVGFPCNQFGAQEPGTHDEICQFTSSKYNVSFPLMAKIDVNGPARLGLFERLCQTAVAGGEAGDVRWNFEKFLIDSEGNVQRFSTGVKPNALGL